MMKLTFKNDNEALYLNPANIVGVSTDGAGGSFVSVVMSHMNMYHVAEEPAAVALEFDRASRPQFPKAVR